MSVAIVCMVNQTALQVNCSVSALLETDITDQRQQVKGGMTMSQLADGDVGF